LDLKKELGKSFAIKVSYKEKEYFSKRQLLKNLMMKMNENDLIGCAIHAEVYHDFEKPKQKERYQLSPSVIEKIRNLKPNKINTQPVITKGLRTVSLQKLKKEFNNPLVNGIENDIFEVTHNDFNEYSNKVNDIVFIFSEYPKFKEMLLSGKVSTKQLVLFEKEIAFETLVNKVHIRSRINVIKRFKIELKNNKILNKVGTIIASNLVAKRLELLLYDISNSNQIYNIYYNKMLKYINNFKNNRELLLFNFLIPLVTGGFFCIALQMHHLFVFIAPATLIFYGLALVQASKYTVTDVQYLGYLQIVLGLLSLFFLGWGLVFWAIGFGVLHIVYGLVMHRKYK
jgi:hypothetical protein